MLRAVCENVEAAPDQMLADNRLSRRTGVRQSGRGETELIVASGAKASGRFGSMRSVRHTWRRWPPSCRAHTARPRIDDASGLRAAQWLDQDVLGFRQFSVRVCTRSAPSEKLVCLALNLRRMAVMANAGGTMRRVSLLHPRYGERVGQTRRFYCRLRQSPPTPSSRIIRAALCRPDPRRSTLDRVRIHRSSNKQS